MNKYLIGFAALVFPVQAQASEFFAERGGWTVMQSDDSCTMGMEYAGPGSTSLLLMKSLDGGLTVGVQNANWSAKDDAEYDITLMVDETSFGGGKSFGYGGYKSRGFMTLLAPEFEAVFGAGDSLHVFLGSERIDQLSLDGTAGALEQVNRCLVKLRAIGDAAKREKARWEHLPADPFASTVPAPPTGPRNPIPQYAENWGSTNDYPSRALREGREGIAFYEVTVGMDGRVISCRIAQTSGHADLDESTCRNVSRRGRFNPALDLSGKLIEGVWAGQTKWEIPD